VNAAQLARAFVNGKPFRLSLLKHSSLLDPFISYEENKVLLIRSLTPNLGCNVPVYVAAVK
jgi:hypothetical protein